MNGNPEPSNEFAGTVQSPAAVADAPATSDAAGQAEAAQMEIPTPVETSHAIRVRGEVLTELPRDLYIPPDALEVFFDTFEGPLDLLLYLIRKANVDILDIPMAKLTQQYIEYVEVMRQKNLELAAEYLVMAAMLMEIKSRILLPRARHVEEGEQDPRAELVRRLLEYEQMKAAALRIDSIPQVGRDVFTVEVWIERTLTERLPGVNPSDLEEAWRSLLMRAKVTQHHRITRDELSVREYMTIILRRLTDAHGFVDFAALFDTTKGVPLLVVNFLAVLELVRETLIEVTQSEPFAPIYVKIANAQSE